MFKSGLITGLASLILISGASLLTPLCTPCMAILVGLTAGILAYVFDHPLTTDKLLLSSGGAGAIAGVFGVVASMIGGVLNATALTVAMNSGQVSTLCGSQYVSDPQTIWVGQLGAACCLSTFNIFVMAILGVVGGSIWRQIRSKPVQSS